MSIGSELAEKMQFKFELKTCVAKLTDLFPSKIPKVLGTV
jgi:hypothetical protein